VVPILRTRSPVEKSLPEMVALTGRNAEPWQRGQSFDLGSGIRVDVLHPPPETTQGHASDRALVLLFHAGSQTLLWAGRIGAQTQQEILAAYPGLHADVLVMGTEPPPADAWLRALQVRDWLQIPALDPRLNSTQSTSVAESCQVWPLSETGAVDLHFHAATDKQPAEIILRPWMAMPAAR
jgi:hypothetical protein